MPGRVNTQVANQSVGVERFRLQDVEVGRIAPLWRLLVWLGLLFAVSFVRSHPTGARESLRVAAGCTPGPSPCTPSEHMPRHWFALRHRHNLSNTHRRPSPHRPPSPRSSSRREYGVTVDHDESTAREARTVLTPYSVRPEPLPHALAPAKGSLSQPEREPSWPNAAEITVQ